MANGFNVKQLEAERSQQEVARIMGVSKRRIQILEQRAIGKLRAMLEELGIDLADAFPQTNHPAGSYDKRDRAEVTEDEYVIKGGTPC